jgi:hypothetical protein
LTQNPDNRIVAYVFRSHDLGHFDCHFGCHGPGNRRGRYFDKAG